MRALALDAASGYLYVGGSFISVGPVNYVNGMARYDIASSTWSALGDGFIWDSLYYWGVQALAFDAATGSLYAGGDFRCAKKKKGAESVASNRWCDSGDVSGTQSLAKYDIASSIWSALGTGVSGASWDLVSALLIDSSSGLLYVGGSFASAGGVTRTGKIAKWNIASSTFSALGSGVVGDVKTMSFDALNNTLYVGTGDNRMATWNIFSSSWNYLGFNGSATSLAMAVPLCTAGNVPGESTTTTTSATRSIVMNDVRGKSETRGKGGGCGKWG